MLNPELAHFLIRAGQGQIVLHHGMREIRGVEVNAHAALFGIVHPNLKILRLNGVAVMIAILKYCIAGMQVQLVLAGNQRKCLVQVCHQLLGRGGLARIIAGRLNAAGKRAVVVKAGHIIALPTVHGNGQFQQFFDRLLGIHTDGSILRLGVFVSVHSFPSICFQPLRPEFHDTSITQIPPKIKENFRRKATCTPHSLNLPSLDT